MLLREYAFYSVLDPSTFTITFSFPLNSTSLRVEIIDKITFLINSPTNFFSLILFPLTLTIIFEVSDNGCGMDEEVKRKLFTSFFSTKGGKGTGLGLLVTQKIVKEHGGTIEVKSKQGEGSTFTVKIPKR